jgi:hypothetical protein
MNTVTLNLAQRLYVLAFDGGVSCLGFDNAQAHADQIAERLGLAELAFTASDHGTLEGYAKYQRAIRAWAQSALSRQTYFDPGTPVEIARALESCRKARTKVRLVLGDPGTGESWLDEHDVVGTIGRSTGVLKVPLLVEDGESGGGAILTACVLCIIDWASGRVRARQAVYQPPALSIQPSNDAAQGWTVLRGDQEVARFTDIGKAGAYLAFMRGRSVDPRVIR